MNLNYPIQSPFAISSFELKEKNIVCGPELIAQTFIIDILLENLVVHGGQQKPQKFRGLSGFHVLTKHLTGDL